MHVELATISTISPIRGRPRLVARPLSECRMSEQGPRFLANTHTHTHTDTQTHTDILPTRTHAQNNNFSNHSFTLFQGWCDASPLLSPAETECPSGACVLSWGGVLRAGVLRSPGWSGQLLWRPAHGQILWTGQLLPWMGKAIKYLFVLYLFLKQ